jgi:hypothetical protein
VYLFPQQRLDIIFSSAAFFVAAAVCSVINLFLLLCSFYLRSLCRLLKVLLLLILIMFELFALSSAFYLWLLVLLLLGFFGSACFFPGVSFNLMLLLL